MTTVLAKRTAPRAVSAHEGRLRRVLYAAHLDPSRKFGSMEEQAFLLAKAFQERAGLFLPVFPARPEAVGLACYRDAGLEFATLDLSRFRPATLGRLLRLVVRHRIEVIDWNFLPPLTNGYLWAMSVLAPRVEHYFTDHNSRPSAEQSKVGLSAALKRILLRRYSRVIGVSRFVADSLRGAGCWPEPHTRLHFVNTDRFAPDSHVRAEVRRRLDAEGRFVLTAVAYLIRAKGIDVAVRALAQLPDSVVLWVVGDGEQAAALEGLARELGVCSRVRFLGLQARVEPYLQAADAFVCPSLWAEAAGLVNLEAQACGLPVLASRIGGIPEYVTDGQAGELFPPGDFEALEAAVRRLLGRPERTRQMAVAARASAVERFSAAARIHEYLNLYRS